MEKELEKLKKQLEKYEQERDEYLNGWKRSKAAFLNYKKEEAEKMTTLAEYAKIDLLLKILPILDNLERAERDMSAELKKGQVFKGFLQIVTQWREFLKSQSIEEIKTVGMRFNPQFHQAVQEIGGEKSGMVVEEVEKGYTMDGKLLRVAKVKVTK